MKISYAPQTRRPSKTDLLVAFVPEPDFKKAIAPFRKALGARFDRSVKLGHFSGKKGSTLAVLPEGKLRADRLLLIGIGANGSAETFRRGASAAVQAATGARARNLTIQIPGPEVAGALAPADIAGALAEGALLGGYRYRKYITSKDDGAGSPVSVTLAGGRDHPAREISRRLAEARTIASSVALARDLANAPGNEIYPESLAAAARRAGAAAGFKVTIWNDERIASAGFGGLTAVGSGSARLPRFIIMEYNPSPGRPGGRGGTGRRETIVLVGKGVTFDSGGISIKPAAGMGEMRMDMSGAAAVIGTLDAASRLSLPIRLIGLVPTAENMLGGRSMRPGDIITHYGGTTSEVDNTDAEGRLILADALAYASTFKPDAVIDLATLTGACVVALGHHASGMMGNHEELMAQLKAAGERTYERVWPLPLFEEYDRQIKSDVADVKNTGGKWAGAITAGLFLKRFIGSWPWVHLDIAGTAILDESLPYAPKGASGVGVRLLVEFLKRRCA